LLAPQPNTPDCTTLQQRYANKFSPDTNASQKACIWNPLTQTPYNYIAFVSQDRSSFFSKYGAGLRLTHIYAPARADAGVTQQTRHASVLDLVLGQDESVTGGGLKGAVFKIDGRYPFPYGKLSYLYLFGTSETRLTSNTMAPPLTLATPSGTVPAIPNSSVAVIRLAQPNRDFWQFGFGLNLADILQSLKRPVSSAGVK
jgi:hypothetical protein